MSSGDIKLDGDWVIVEGKWTKVRTLDIMLDAPSRRKNNTGLRRALVHDPDDGLTINWNRDYPGGVKIKGSLSVESVKADSLSLKGKLQARSIHVDETAVVVDRIMTPDILITAPRNYPHPLGVPVGQLVLYNLTELVHTLSAEVQTLKALEAEVRTLKAKVPIGQLTAGSGRQYLVMPEALEDDSLMFTDRDYRYVNVPWFLKGATYIATANEDKFSKDENFLSFSVGTPVIVYIAHDNRYKEKPSWLKSFEDIGHDLSLKDPSSEDHHTDYSLFKKDYPAGTIVLGGNITPTETQNFGMYTVVVEARLSSLLQRLQELETEVQTLKEKVARLGD